MLNVNKQCIMQYCMLITTDSNKLHVNKQVSHIEVHDNEHSIFFIHYGTIIKALMKKMKTSQYFILIHANTTNS